MNSRSKNKLRMEIAKQEKEIEMFREKEVIDRDQVSTCKQGL